MSLSVVINKNNIDKIFECFSKNYSKVSNKPINLMLVGGSSILLNFDYRQSTIDIDAFYKENKQVQEAIQSTANELNLPNDWLNNDFMNTPSYSDKLTKVTELYKRYGSVEVNVVKPIYLIAMKIKSSRPTGGDLEDIVMMIYELRNAGSTISYEDVIKAYDYLYVDRSNSYDSFFVKTKNAFDTPIDEVRDILNHQKEMRNYR